MSSNSDRPTETADTDRSSATNERAPPPQERRPQRRESVMDSLSGPAVQNYLKDTIGLFGVIGFGFGLAGFLIITLTSGGNLGIAYEPSSVGFTLLLVTLFIGPVIAGFSGRQIATGLREDARTVYLTSAIGNFVGYFVMALVTILLMAATGVRRVLVGGPVFDLVTLLLPMLALAIPAALVGVGTAYLHRRINIQ